MNVLRGVAGVVKALLGLDQAEPDVAAERLQQCMACDYLQFSGPHRPRCGLCGCLVRLKVQVKGETCPAGLWPS